MRDALLRYGRPVFAAVALAAAAGCTTLPAALDAPKEPTTALATPEATTLGRNVAARAREHPGLSGFRLIVDGKDSFALRLSIAAKAERTLDLQYFLLQQDDTGNLLLAALLDAADRGVRVRILLDDAQAFDAGSTIRPLAAHPNIEIRIYNPFVVRQQLAFLRGAEFLLESGRLNYRMHNKLFVADNAVAITGGRNIGDECFQASSTVEFGDFDLAVAGPMVQRLSRGFDRYWNDKLAVPVETLPLGKPTAADLDACRAGLAEHRRKMATTDYVRSLPTGDRLAEIVSAKSPLVWAKAEFAYDTPDKAQATASEQPGSLMWQRVAQAAEEAQRELIIVSPYLVPGAAEMALLQRLRERGVKVRVLTNSLASTDMPIAHAGYLRYRVPLLEAGVGLYEVRARPGRPYTSRGLIKSGSSEQFALHAKVFVIDRQRVFVGSMNFDQRSLNINTEQGLIIDSPELARLAAERFAAIVEPANSYRLTLDAADGAAGAALRWVSVEDGKTVTYDSEPGVDPVKLARVRLLSLLPIDHLL
jgi:putative cardiolipin synthase